MKLLLTAAAAVTLLATLAIPTPAHALDNKMYHGSDCKVFGSTAWTDLAFSGFGVKNLASSARNIICPILKDTIAVWDGASLSPMNSAYVALRMQTGSVAASWTCTAYVTTVNDTSSVNSYAASSGGQQPANTLADNRYLAYFNSVAGSNGQTDKAYMLCTLGPQVRLVGYFFQEAGGTE